MAILPILEYPHKILRTPAAPVTVFDDPLRKIIADMIDTMYHDDGAGLAANQVGILLQIFVMDISKKEDERKPLCFINPQIVAKEGEALLNEGCLSIPGLRFTIKRATHITVTYQDEFGVSHTLATEGRAAHCIQHESDHLNGILSFDHLSSLKRTLAIKKFEKQRKGLKACE